MISVLTPHMYYHRNLQGVDVLILYQIYNLPNHQSVVSDMRQNQTLQDNHSHRYVIMNIIQML